MAGAWIGISCLGFGRTDRVSVWQHMSLFTVIACISTLEEFQYAST